MHEATRSSLQEINEVFTESLRSADARALSQVYAEDALLMVPDGEIVRGRHDIEA